MTNKKQIHYPSKNVLTIIGMMVIQEFYNLKGKDQKITEEDIAKYCDENPIAGNNFMAISVADFYVRQVEELRKKNV